MMLANCVKVSCERWQGVKKVACRSRARVVVAKRMRPEEAHGLVTTTGAGRGDYLRKARLPAL
jgi:hypothetical protein